MNWLVIICIRTLSHCATTFGRASNLRRHVQHSCKGPKRPAEEELPETPPEKYRLTDYESRPSRIWRAPVETPSDTESEEDDIPSAFRPSQEESEEEPSVESSDEWHTADEEKEPWEGEEASPHTQEPAPLNLDALKKTLPWAQYQGVPEEQFGAATQQLGESPSFDVFPSVSSIGSRGYKRL